MENWDYSQFRPYLSLFILISKSQVHQVKDLFELVKEANETVVGATDILSDSVYEFSRNTGLITMVNI